MPPLEEVPSTPAPPHPGGAAPAGSTPSPWPLHPGRMMIWTPGHHTTTILQLKEVYCWHKATKPQNCCTQVNIYLINTNLQDIRLVIRQRNERCEDHQDYQCNITRISCLVSSRNLIVFLQGNIRQSLYHKFI